MKESFFFFLALDEGDIALLKTYVSTEDRYHYLSVVFYEAD